MRDSQAIMNASRVNRGMVRGPKPITLRTWDIENFLRIESSLALFTNELAMLVFRSRQNQRLF